MSVRRISMLALVAFPAVLFGARTTITSVTPLPNKQIRVCWQGVPDADAYLIQGSEPVENLYVRAKGETICRDVSLFGATECQVNVVTVAVQKRDASGESVFGPQSPHFHFLSTGTYPIGAGHVGDDFISPSPVCSPASRYPTTEASENMGPSALKLTDITTESDLAPGVRLNLKCPETLPNSLSVLKKYEIYESFLKTDGSTATQTVSRDSCPNDLVIKSDWGDRVTITVAAIYFHSADQKQVHSVCAGPKTITFGGSLVGKPELQLNGHRIEGTLDGKARDVLLFTNAAEAYKLDSPGQVVQPHDGRFSAPVHPKRGLNRIDAVARRTVQGHEAFSEPAEVLIPSDTPHDVMLADVPAFELTSQLYVAGTAAPASPVTIQISRGETPVYTTTLYTCANGAFGSDVRLPRLPAGAYRITANVPGSKQAFGAGIHFGEIAPSPAISVDAGPGPFFVNGTTATITGKITPRIESTVAERYEGKDSTAPTLLTQSGSGYGMLAVVNGKEIPFEPSEDSTFSFEAPLQTGANTIRLQANTTLTNQTAPPVEISVVSGRQVPGAADLNAVNHALNLGWDTATSDRDAAFAAFTKVIELDPGAAAGYAGRAAVSILRENAREAFDDATKAVELDARNFRAWSYRANYLLEQQKNQDVIDTASRAIALDPTWSMPFENRSGAQLNLEHFAEAAADATKAIEIQEKNPYALRVRALAYHHLGRNSEALEDIRKAIDLEPQSTWSIWIQAQIQAAFGEYAQAIENFTKLIATDPASAQSYYVARAWAQYETGKLDDALGDIARSMMLKENAYAYSTRAWIRFAKGDTNAAIADLAKAKTFDAAYSGVAIDEGLLDFIHGDDAKAAEVWEAALAHDADPLPIVAPLLAKARDHMTEKQR